jgi:hypothetical protein
VPAGIVAGRLIWQAFAANLGVVAVSVVSARAFAVAALGTLVLANVLAAGPALVAARARPGEPAADRMRLAGPAAGDQRSGAGLDRANMLPSGSVRYATTVPSSSLFGATTTLPPSRSAWAAVAATSATRTTKTA